MSGDDAASADDFIRQSLLEAGATNDDVIPLDPFGTATPSLDDIAERERARRGYQFCYPPFPLPRKMQVRCRLVTTLPPIRA